MSPQPARLETGRAQKNTPRGRETPGRHVHSLTPPWLDWNIPCNGTSCGTVDGHPDVIDTEIVSMSLSGGGIVLRVGDEASATIPSSLGTVVETGDPAVAESFFDLFVELEVGGLQLYNHAPFRLRTDITLMPPQATYLEVTQCVPLFDDPTSGIQIGALVFAVYSANRCGNNVVGDQEACDGTDDTACPDQCQPDCSCP